MNPIIRYEPLSEPLAKDRSRAYCFLFSLSDNLLFRTFCTRFTSRFPGIIVFTSWSFTWRCDRYTKICIHMCLYIRMSIYTHVCVSYSGTLKDSPGSSTFVISHVDKATSSSNGRVLLRPISIVQLTLSPRCKHLFFLKHCHHPICNSRGWTTLFQPMSVHVHIVSLLQPPWSSQLFRGRSYRVIPLLLPIHGWNSLNRLFI